MTALSYSTQTHNPHAFQQSYKQIARRWHEILTGNQQPTTANAQEQLELLLLRACKALQCDTIDEREPYAIGAQLVDLGFHQPDSAKKSIALFQQQIVGMVPLRETARVFTNLFHFQSAFFEGFACGMRKHILDEQRHITTVFLGRQRQIEMYLRTLLSSAPVVFCVLDCSGVISYIAGHALALLHVKPEALIGRSIYDLAYEFPELAGFITGSLHGEERMSTIEIRDISFDVRCIPTRDADHTLSGVIGVAVAALGQGASASVNSDREYAFSLLNELDHALAQRVQQRSQPEPAPPEPAAADPDADAQLAPSERDLLQMLMAGKTNRQISDQMSLSEKAIEKRLTKLYLKLNVKSRTETIAWAITHRLV